MIIIVLPACMYVQICACLILAEVRRRLWNAWNLSYYGWLVATMQVLGTKPGTLQEQQVLLAAETSLQPGGFASHHGFLVAVNLHIFVTPIEVICSIFIGLSIF